MEERRILQSRWKNCHHLSICILLSLKYESEITLLIITLRTSRHSNWVQLIKTWFILWKFSFEALIFYFRYTLNHKRCIGLRRPKYATLFRKVTLSKISETYCKKEEIIIIIINELSHNFTLKFFNVNGKGK